MLNSVSALAVVASVLALGLLHCSSNDSSGAAANVAGASGTTNAAAGAPASAGVSEGSSDAVAGASGSVGAAAGGSAWAGASFAGAVATGASGSSGEPSLSAYAKAPYETTSGIFTLKANATPVDVVEYYKLYSYAHLAYEGTATFTVSLNSGASISSFDISPHSYGLNATATKSGATLTFSRTQANSSYLIIKIKTSSGALQNLVIAADPYERDVPAIGGTVHDITAAPYDADKSGASLMTSTIQNAIDATSGAGGGTLYFPPGVYKFSTIRLKSNVTLYLAEGAVLRGSSNRNDYTWDHSSLVNGDPKFGQQNILILGNVSNVAIKGRGMVDANSTSLASPSKTGGQLDGWGGYRKGIIASKQVGSDLPNGITIEGVVVKDATTWSFDIEDSQNVAIKNVKLLNDYTWIHSDGFDICSTTNALVDNCLGVTGDDVFDAKGNSTNPLANVTYSNSVAYSFKGTGTKIGVGAKSRTDNISFNNIDVVAAQRGVSLSHDEGSGVWTNIHCTDIRTETIVGTSTSGQFLVAPLVIWTAAYGDGSGPLTGVDLLRCSFENTAGRKGVIQGYDSVNNVSDVRLHGVTIDGMLIDASNYSTKIAVGANVNNLSF